MSHLFKAAVIACSIITGLTVTTAQDQAPFQMPLHDHPEDLVGDTGFEGPSAMAFDSKNRPYMFNNREPESFGFITTLRQGQWDTLRYLDELQDAYPNLVLNTERWHHALSQVVIDTADCIYIMLYIYRGSLDSSRIPVLLYSDDYGQNFQVYDMPGTPELAILEVFTGYNNRNLPPAIGLYTKIAKVNGLDWAYFYNMEVIFPGKSGDSLEFTAPVTVTDSSFGHSHHSGGQSFACTQDSLTHVVYVKVPTDPVTGGNPTYIATIDRRSNSLVSRQYLCNAYPTETDVHSTPVVTADSGGFVHVLSGAHNNAFYYLRTLQPRTIDGGWTGPRTVMSGQSYATLVCDGTNRLHSVFRIQPRLRYSYKAASANYWPDAVTLVNPPGGHTGYAVYYHRLFIDPTRENIYTSFSFWEENTGQDGIYPRALAVTGDGGETWQLATTALLWRNTVRPTAQVSVTLLDSGTHQPLEGIDITVTGLVAWTAVSDSSGKAVFEVDPGLNGITVAGRNGYPGKTGLAVDVPAGGTGDTVIYLTRKQTVDFYLDADEMILGLDESIGVAAYEVFEDSSVLEISENFYWRSLNELLISVNDSGIIRTHLDTGWTTVICSSGAAGISDSIAVHVLPEYRLYPLADAYIRPSGYINDNFGDETRLVVKEAAAIYIRRSFLRFNFEKVTLPVISAELNLFCVQHTQAISRVMLFSSEDTDWEDNTITWNNQPAVSADTVDVATIGGIGSAYQWDVSGFLDGSIPAVSLMLQSQDASVVSFNSKEAASDPPVIIIPVYLTPPVDTAAPSIVAVSAPADTTVQVLFSEPVEAALAEDVSNYSITGLTIGNAARGGDMKTVTLTVSPMTDSTRYDIIIDSVRDLADTANTAVGLAGQFHFYAPVVPVDSITFDTVYVNGIGVIASSDDGNGPENTLDGSLATRWSADGQGEWIQYDFGRTVNFTGIGVSFYRGDERTSTIAVSVSDDGSSWTGVLGSTTSSGTTTELEDFPFDTTFTGRYLRITGYGNSTNDWVSFTEVRFDTVAGTVGMANPGNGITGHGIRIFSNPVQGTAVITTAGPVQVFDAAGGLVHSFPGNRRSSKTVLWDGTDMAGQPVENGIYVIRAGNAVKRIIYRK